MIDRPLLSDLRLMHGIYNSCMMLLFSYQGWLGFRIRRAVRARALLPVLVIRRHRKAGLVLVLMGGAGFFTGLSIVVLLIATYKISRDI